MKAKNISYSPSIYNASSFEVLAGGLLVGNINAAADSFTACPHRHKRATFGTLAGALDYFGAIFGESEAGADGSVLVGGATKNQLSIF